MHYYYFFKAYYIRSNRCQRSCYSETALSNSNVNYFWSIKNSSEVIEKLRLRNFRGSQVSSFDFSILYTSLPHDLIKAKVLSLVNRCFNRESKTYLCTSDKAGFFSNKKYDSYKCWTCAELCEVFTFLCFIKCDYMTFWHLVKVVRDVFEDKRQIWTRFSEVKLL